MSKNCVGVGILGIGSYAPEKILTNKELETIVETSDQWITERSGIKERRIASSEQATSDLANIAAERALEDANVLPEEIDLIIVATNTPDYFFPATACIVQDYLGSSRAGAFDLLAGCTGFVYALSTAAQFVISGMYKKILVIGAETLSKVVDWEDRKTCVLFGDGAGAVLLGAVPEGYGLIHSKLGSDGSGKDFLSMPGGGSRIPSSRNSVESKQHFLKMNGREVFKFAVRSCGDGTIEALKEVGMSPQDVDFFVPHQANDRIIRAAAKKLDIPFDKIAINLDRFGNTSTASIPMALEEAVKQNRINDGDNLVMTAFGAGLTWGVAILKWYDYRQKKR